MSKVVAAVPPVATAAAPQLQGWRARLAAIDDGELRLGPETVHLDITNACNTDCVTCWDHSPHLQVPQPIAWKRQRADIERLCALVDDIASLGGLRAIIVSGMGEPFTHPGIYDLLSHLRSRGLHITVITNLVAADLDRVLGPPGERPLVDALLVGVQGASERSYLDFHPSFAPRHWAHLRHGLDALAGRGVQVKHVQVICRHNAHELAQMVRLAAATRAAHVNFKLASLRRGTEVVACTAAQREALSDRDIAEAEVEALMSGVSTNLVVFRQQVEAQNAASTSCESAALAADPSGDATSDEAVGDDSDAPPTADIREVGCWIGTSYARITVDGTVLYCCNTEVVVGHLVAAPFSVLWRGEAWRRWRQRMRAGDYLPSCRQCGKFNQNVKLSERFRATYGDRRWRECSGRGDAEVA